MGSLGLTITRMRRSFLEKGLYSLAAAGLLLGSCACSLAARRLCATTTHERAGEGGPEAAQARREREGSLSALA